MTMIYTIRPGDSLTKIAKLHSATLAELLDLNLHIDNPDLIYAGQPINVPDSGNSGTGATSEGAPGEVEPNWMTIARGELGVVEYPGMEHNPRIVEYHATTTHKASTDEVPWCSSFANWCMIQHGLKGTNSAAARSWLHWGKKIESPKTGCVVIFSSSRGPASGHVGFFERSQGAHILVLGGNQKDAVNYSSYSKTRLLGFRWPKE
jgi:uncharacterized protein (TIGR02594 family)